MGDQQQPKVDRNELPPEVRSVPAEQLEAALANVAKAHASAAEIEARKKKEHEEIVRSGKALDVTKAHLRAYGGEEGQTEQITGEGGGH